MYRINPITGKMELTGETLLIEKTYSELSTLIAASELIPGTVYKITDRGDRGLFFEAISTNQLSRSGQRLMLCPAWYGTGEHEGNNWLGIWNDQLSPVADDLVIWGGLVWKNSNGNIGSVISENELDTSEWTLITKAAFANSEYVEMIFDVDYDFENDWIDQQRDQKGNVIGIDYASNQNEFSFTYNPVDLTDWNFANRTDTCLFMNNKSAGIFNNPFALYIYNNNVYALIRNNTCSSDIYNNEVFGDIRDNSNGGEIACNKASSITNNSNIGNIYGNITEAIVDNSNLGEISNNVCLSIDTNSNSGNIYYNSNRSIIQNNSNLGHIQFCTIDGHVTAHADPETDVTVKDYDTAIGDIQEAIDLINGEVV